MDNYNSYFCDCIKSKSNQKGFGNKRDLLLSNFKNLFDKGDIRHYGDPTLSRNIVKSEISNNGERIRRRRKTFQKRNIKSERKPSKKICRKTKSIRKNKTNKGKRSVKQSKLNSRVKATKRVSKIKTPKIKRRVKAVKPKKIFRDIFN